MPVLEGTAYWASVKTPNTTYEPTYSVNLVVDEATAEDFKTRGFTVKPTEDGPAIIIKRKVNGPRGMIRDAPKLYDRSKNEVDCQVGNGSRVKVQFKEWTSERNGQTFNGLDFMAMQIIDLVQYSGQAGDEFDSLDDELEDEL
jgi:PKD repeat protein